MVVEGSADDYESRHPAPAEALLLVEVTDTTAERDTVAKVRLYGAAGIPEYWVVLLNPREVLVYRNPTSAGYPDPLRLGDGDIISPLVAPGVTLAVSDLLPAVAATDV
jgi:Uma2 family endonuclease